MNKPFPYTSLHDYLDTALSHIDNPSHQEIKQAKRNYWKQYYTHYRRQKRIVRKEYTLGFDTHSLKQLQQKKGNLSVSQFLYQIVEQAIDGKRQTVQDKTLLGNIDRQLMKLINLLEDLLASEHTELNEQVLEQIENLETLFSQTFKSQQL
ncbi:hypothetical protein [Gaetbulibacter jejuensis]|uniref:hypothetical protein n=1 Tax=Gaetbulibacter jejuensis TaxID=584607 RepID=UPI003009E71F